MFYRKSILLGVLGALMFLAGCKGDDEGTTTVVVQEETEEDEFQKINNVIQVARDLVGSSSTSFTATSAKVATDSLEFDLCSFYETAFEDVNGDQCFSFYVECVDGGAALKYVFDYGNGCSMAGETYTGIFACTFGLNYDNQDTVLYEFDNFGIDGDAITGSGVQVSAFDEVVFEIVVNTTASYSIVSSEETITLDYSSEMTSGLESTMLDMDYSGSSSKGFSFEGDASDITYKYECQEVYGFVSVIYPSSGTETFVITEDNQDVELVVDYGDGTCDDIYTITDEAGVTTSYSFKDDEPI